MLLYNMHMIPHKDAICFQLSMVCQNVYDIKENSSMKNIWNVLEIQFSNKNSILLKIFIDILHYYLSCYFIETCKEYPEYSSVSLNS